jgi:hypothetical protein
MLVLEILATPVMNKTGNNTISACDVVTIISFQFIAASIDCLTCIPFYNFGFDWDGGTMSSQEKS